MKLLSVHLTNVRRFVAQRASLTHIGAGITVVSEANEFGKSTFFDAIHALFFEKYSSSAKQVKSLQPYAGGAVEIAADVETGDGQFRVEKRFLSKKQARVTRLPEGTLIAQDDEAERWISTLLGTASDGPAGLLWVRQGQLGLDAESAKEKSLLMETRRDLLSSVAGEIDTMTGGRRMDRVMRSVSDSLGEIATKTGLKRGAWKSASEEVEQLGTEVARITTQVQMLEKALSDRKHVDATIRRLDAPEAKVRRETALSAAQTSMEAAQAHAGITATARQTRDLASHKAQAANAALDAFLKALETAQSAQQSALERHRQNTLADGDLQTATQARDLARHSNTEALESLSKARDTLERARVQINARKAQADAIRLGDTIAKADIARGERDAALASLKASAATPAWLRTVEEAHGDMARRLAALEAQATSVTLSYSGASRVRRNGVEVPECQSVTLEGDTDLELDGIGTMTIRTSAPSADARAALREAEAAIRTVFAKAQVTSLTDARAAARERAEAQAKADLAKVVFETLAPDGIEALRTAKADADLAAAGIAEDDLPPIGDLERMLSEANERAQATRLSLTAAERDFAAMRERTIETRTLAQAAQMALEHSEAEAGPEDTRDERRKRLLRVQVESREAEAQANAALDDVVKAAPDMDTVTAEFQRAQAAVVSARQERAQMGERLASLSSEIRTLAGHGIEERHDELTGALEAARIREARYGRRAAVLSRLQSALEAERSAARDTYFGPVQAELKPLLSILHRDATLRFDTDSLLPNGLMRNDSDETLDVLSGGTKEQIAILTRLAFARLFARQGRHMPIILDDALVFSDDDRIVKMFTALTRVAQDQQILVFSCRQLAFQDLGGTRAQIEIVDL